MARFCTTCGAPVDDQAAFCPTCGAKLIDQSPAPDEQADVTTRIERPEATTSLPTASADAPNPPSPADDGTATPRRKTVPLSALVAVIACAIVICGGALAVMTFHPFGIGTPDVQASTTDDADSEKDADEADTEDGEADDKDADAEDGDADDKDEDAPARSDDADEGDTEEETPVVQNTIIVQSDPQESRPQQSAPAPQSTSAPNNYFVCPDSDTHLYTDSELYAMSPDDLEIARNEIYARYGRGFNSTSLQGYFDSQAWYTRLYSPEEFDAMESPLNSIEQENVVNMLRVETDLRN